MPTIFRIRQTRPKRGRWNDVTADTLEDAIQDLHYDGAGSWLPGINFAHTAPDGCNERIYFAAFEVEGFKGEYISRIFWRGITRAGGVKPHGAQQTIAEVAAALGWSRAPEELLAEWDGEETWDIARALDGKRKTPSIKIVEEPAT